MTVPWDEQGQEKVLDAPLACRNKARMIVKEAGSWAKFTRNAVIGKAHRLGLWASMAVRVSGARGYFRRKGSDQQRWRKPRTRAR